MKKLELVKCHMATAVAWVVFWALWSCFHVAGGDVGSSALGQGCSVDWNESRRLPRLQLPSFCLPVEAKPKVKVNGQSCDCHLRWAREISSPLQTSEPQEAWLVTHLLCHKNDGCCYFVFLMTSARELPLDELPGGAWSPWSTAAVILMDGSAWFLQSVCI